MNNENLNNLEFSRNNCHFFNSAYVRKRNYGSMSTDPVSNPTSTSVSLPFDKAPRADVDPEAPNGGKKPPVDVGVLFWRTSIRESIMATFDTCVEALIPIVLDFLVPTCVQLPAFNLKRDRPRLVYINGGNAHPALYSVTSLLTLPECGQLARNELLLVAQPYHRDWQQLMNVEFSDDQIGKFSRFLREGRRTLPSGTTVADGTALLKQSWSTMTRDEKESFMETPEVHVGARDSQQATRRKEESKSNMLALTEMMEAQTMPWGVDRCQLSAAEAKRLSDCHPPAQNCAASLNNDEEVARMTTVGASTPVWYQTRIIVWSLHAVGCKDGCCVCPSHGPAYGYPSAHISAPLPVPNPVTREWLCDPDWSVSAH